MTNTQATADFLVEIGCEELPPKLLKKIQESFSLEISKALNLSMLSFNNIETFITPRRIALRIIALAKKQPPQSMLRKGPTKAAAFDEHGKPTKATLGFAQSCGVAVEALTVQETDKGAWLVFQQTTEGRSAEQLLPTIINEILNNLSLGRRMRWGNLDYHFFRPIHWVLLLLGNQVIEAEIMGIKANNVTYGHRFHHPNPLIISTPLAYEKVLEEKGFVIASFEKRRQIISNKLQEKAPENTFIDSELLEEVTGLVEWPIVLRATFDKSFLEIPKEVLMAAMQIHQKCFPIIDKKSQLLSEFLIVSNTENTNPKHIVAGNEWVVQARLSDAAFYYFTDKKKPLHQRREDLKQIRFQQGLGTLWDKSERITKLAELIAKTINADIKATLAAAVLCKADLLTLMVGEFPELQGTMGYYYALHDKASETTAKAIKEHYYPRFATDTLPSTLEGASIALADRMDSLVGLFGIGNKPTGDKDPFALRRQALGILRILIEKELALDLRLLLIQAKELYGAALSNAQVVEEVLEFCFERLRAWSQEKGIAPRIFEAIFAKRPTNPLDIYHRMLAANNFIKLEASESLIAANKRVKNILTKSEKPIASTATIDATLFKEEVEKILWAELSTKEKEVDLLLQEKNYQAILNTLSTLRNAIDAFFDKVMIMVEEESLRNNRLSLLVRIRNLFSEVADISLL